MEHYDKNRFFELVSVLTDQSIPSDETGLRIYENFNKLSEITNTTLPDLIDETTFVRKYEILDRIKDFLLSVRLYAFLPELTNKHIFCSFRPDEKMQKDVYKRFLKEAMQGYESGKTPFLQNITTLLVHGKSDRPEFFAFTSNDKKVELSADDYKEMLDKGNSASDGRMELSGLVHLVGIRCRSIPENYAALIIPEDIETKYKNTFFRLADTVIYSGKDFDKINETFARCNVKQVVVKDENVPNAEKKLHLPRFSPSVISFSEYEKNVGNEKPFRNFAQTLMLEALFSEVLWGIAQDKRAMNEHHTLLKMSLTAGGEDIKSAAKEMSTYTEDLIEDYNNICGRYKSVMEEMRKCTETIEESCGEKAGLIYNDHAQTRDELLGHFCRMCEYFGTVEDSSSLQTVNNLRSLCSSVDDVCAAVSDIIYNDYRNAASDVSAMNVLKDFSSDDPSVCRLRIRHRKELAVTDSACAEIIERLPLPLTPEELRLLGLYHIKKGRTDEARGELFEAMARGDKKAGTEYLKKFCIDDTDNTNIAMFGSPYAAVALGSAAKTAWEKNPKSDALFHAAVKFLNIAASSGVKDAYALLGALWYSKGIIIRERERKEAEKCFRACLSNYESSSKKDYTIMGYAEFLLKNYSSAREYLQKAETAEAYYLLGVIYEEGHGVSKSRKKAVENYKKAKDAGDERAKAAYERMKEEYEAEERRKREEKEKSYAATREITDYHSGGGGW